MNRTEAQQRFAEARVAHLATVSPDGRPHVVPCTFAVLGDWVVTAVDGKPKRTKHLQRLVNIGRYPNVSLLVDRYAEDWTRLWWVRADGTAVIEEEGPDREAAIAALAAKYPQYVAEPPTGPAIVVVVDGWRWWAASPSAEP
ncbi:MAG TPA: TIGR03668 family PPOX class F420-dependent oxidoreductase [Actinomycetota bacterium]|jgi:PPOX class probable F420-dependent enzyme